MDALRWSDYANIVVLTGAGISAGSGLRTYRGPDGVWDEYDVADIATGAALRRDPRRVWRFIDAMRRQVAAVKPNAAHRALSRLESRLAPSQSLTILTQNVDGLHQAAGNRDVVELHGTIARSRCMQPGCRFSRDEDFAKLDSECPRCPFCGSWLRADVVLFDELLPDEAVRRAGCALQDCDLFIAIGTSGVVYPAADYVRSARVAGARTLLVNLEEHDEPNPCFQELILGRAEEVLDALVG